MVGRALLLAVGFLVLMFICAVAWHSFAFKYMYQFVTSGGLLLTAFYYLWRPGVTGNIKTGLSFLLLSPVAFFASDLLFAPLRLQGIVPPGYVFGWDLSFLSMGVSAFPGAQVWHFLFGFGLFANAMALARRPRPIVILAANMIAVLATFVVVLWFR